MPVNDVSKAELRDKLPAEYRKLFEEGAASARVVKEIHDPTPPVISQPSPERVTDEQLRTGQVKRGVPAGDIKDEFGY
ncbi:MAG: hypothetical protein UY21_C0009G0067 [Microgenomates group bacterium GW2011_GWA1_48_10]|nr:MAG: hypothetical protein UY21_C0009G0067 [Microgenomates group bacterium GW2011_GWA1_48_10]